MSAFDGRSLLSKNTTTQAINFFAGDQNNREGVRVAVKDLDNDGRGDLVTSAGSGRTVTGYFGTTLAAAPAGTTPSAAFTFDTADAVTGGVFVG